MRGTWVFSLPSWTHPFLSTSSCARKLQPLRLDALLLQYILSVVFCLCCLVTFPILTFSKTKEKNHLIQEVQRTTLLVVEKCFEWIIPFSLCQFTQKHIPDPVGIIDQEGKALRTNNFWLCSCAVPARLRFLRTVSLNNLNYSSF